MSSSAKLILGAAIITVLAAVGGIAGALRVERDRHGTPAAMAVGGTDIASTLAASLPASPVTPDAERNAWITRCKRQLAATFPSQDLQALCDCLFDQLAAKVGTNGATEFGPQVFLNPMSAPNNVVVAASDAMEGCKAKLGP
jgi:hypothetical protein